MSEVSILLPDDTCVMVLLGDDAKVSDAVSKVVAGLAEKESDTSKYRLLERMVSSEGPPQDRLLEGDESIASVRARQAKAEEEGRTLAIPVQRQFEFRAVHEDLYVSINFNIYLRMAAGIAEKSFRLYATSSMTVDKAIALIFKRLRLQPDSTNYGLFGTTGEGTRELARDENLLGLQKGLDENTRDLFFQFQTKMDLSALLGADRQGWLEKEGGNVKSWKSRWFVLKGTSLFYYPDHKDPNPLGQIANVDKAKLVLPDANEAKGGLFARKSRNQHVFMLELPDRTWKLAAPDRPTMDGWVAAIREAATRGSKAQAAAAAAAMQERIRSASSAPQPIVPERKASIPSATPPAATPTPAPAATPAAAPAAAAAPPTAAAPAAAAAAAAPAGPNFEIDEAPEVDETIMRESEQLFTDLFCRTASISSGSGVSAAVAPSGGDTLGVPHQPLQRSWSGSGLAKAMRQSLHIAQLQSGGNKEDIGTAFNALDAMLGDLNKELDGLNF